MKRFNLADFKVLAWALLFLFYKLQYLYGLPLTTADDSWFYNRVQLGGVHEWIGVAKSLAKDMGRLSLFCATLVQGFSFYFASPFWLFLCQCVPVFANLIAFHYVLRQWTNLRIANVSICIMTALIFIGFDHYSVPAYPLMYTGIFSSLLFGLGRIKSAERLLIPAIAIALPCFFYEMFYPLWALAFFIALTEPRFRSPRAVLTFLWPVVLCAITYFSFRAWAPGTAHYAGVQVRFSLPNFFQALLAFAWGAIWKGNFLGSSVRILSVVACTVFAGVAAFICIPRNKKPISISSPSTVIAISIAMILFPQLLISLTGKYQEWAMAGTNVYVTTYFSQFGWSLLIATCLSQWIPLKMFPGLIALVLLGLSGVSEVKSSETLRILGLKKDQFSRVLKFVDQKAVPGVCYHTNLFEPLGWPCCHPYPMMETYWEDLVYLNSGKRVKLYSHEYVSAHHLQTQCETVNF